MSESEVTDWNWIRANGLNPEIEVEPDEGEMIDLGLVASCLGETGEKIQSGKPPLPKPASKKAKTFVVWDYVTKYEENGKKVKEALNEIFADYKQQLSLRKPYGSGNQTARDHMDVVDHMVMDDGEEGVMDMFWKHEAKIGKVENKTKDVLVVPVSTVASESAFSTDGRVLDVYRSCLTPKIVQALICAQHWLRGISDFNPTADVEEQTEFGNLALGNQIC
ncbi:hypothetical protein COLO4_19897 [Corchorus olitorius]|uniref:HAT C-terminal dimerisation domain-containing protein n=1 Tax=Corchorus olitorius TaxID=93759 RepID=A0A1R3J307_9ROSI|nr:hypothetical protein COLO4_19897 [Corchorus olitorius]